MELRLQHPSTKCISVSSSWESSMFIATSYCTLVTGRSDCAVCCVTYCWPSYMKMWRWLPTSPILQMLLSLSTLPIRRMRYVTSGIRPCMGRNSVLVIAIRYGLDGPGIESRWDEIFRTCPDRLLGRTHPAVQWVPGLFPRGKAAGAWRLLITLI